MIRSLRSLLVPASALALSVLAASCNGDGFGSTRGGRRLVVTFVDPDVKTGTRLEPLPLSINTASRFAIQIQALNPDGTPDTEFSRYVRISATPGAVSQFHDEDTDGRNVLLTNGQSGPVNVDLANAFGETYIIASDLGYVPADPNRQPPPACSDGIDNNGNGLIDYPADPGCAFANDDAEEGGTYAEGASPPIYFKLPRIADMRGLRCVQRGGVTDCSGNGATPYPKQQVLIDTGYHEKAAEDGSHFFAFDFSTVVTRLSTDGFYAMDIADGVRTPPFSGFNSVFAFNFSTPPLMRVCDRLQSFGGTASEFFGFTQISYPTWTLEPWDPAARLCLVPEAKLLAPGDISDTNYLLRQSGGLVRVETLLGDNPDAPIRSAMVTPRFGPDDMPCKVGGVVSTPADKTTCDKDPNSGTFQFVPGDDATNCDFNKDGKITFSTGNPESDCSNACTGDTKCTEWSNFKARSTFRITVTDGNNMSAAIQADGTQAGFDAYVNKGVKLRSFAGVLTYFSGGSQYTVEARCDADVVLDLASGPLPTDHACTPGSDPAKTGCTEGYECVPLRSGDNACRKRVPRPPYPDNLEPPPQACVFPRTFLDNNPQ
ncbi:hypothetical protein AKJ09_09261 [Labilithrix luteola]|uniref:Lipoprotein n=1 Tax=Labilithrix luteola TaxID=1391654 RepID=A0A0K1QA36_9BACT|nr:hypothetical protein [Labilithrix luteola]AKV02598.1 hypothetical protein AKJ09_09261 [Labilithrix luteola]